MKLEEIEKICATQNFNSGEAFRDFVIRLGQGTSTEEEIDYTVCALFMLPKLLAVAKAAKGEESSNLFMTLQELEKE